MNKWMLRGLVFAAGMIVLRLIQGALINAWQTQSTLISVVLLLIYIVCAAVWGVRDGHADATANPDPDRREDLAMIWLLGGLVAGVVSGLVSWIIALFYKGIYTGGLMNELTTFAAFTALLIFLFAIIGSAIGRWRIDRNAPTPEKHDGSRGGSPQRAADTDVFSAVRADDSPTGEIRTGGGQTEERTSSVATVERGHEAPTEVIHTRDSSEAKTEVIRTGDSSEAKTEVLDLNKLHKKPQN